MYHLSSLSMNYPPRKELLDLLKENFSEDEAEVALAIPSKQIPFKGIIMEEISNKTNLSSNQLKNILNSLTERGLLFSYKDKDTNDIKYSLQHAGYGFPQIFFWKGEDTPKIRQIAKQIINYYRIDVTKETFCTNPIPYRFVPVDQTLDIQSQHVFPFHKMEEIIKKADLICVAHCMCRQEMKLLNRDCGHPTEVCMKFNELARYMIDNGFAREISVDEALEISKKASEAGLVHFTDNAIDNVQQNCNCCGCSCWNLGRIRRRHIPRDEIIATYFIRETLEDLCIGCGNCVEICPAAAVNLLENVAVVDVDWCIGCGVCVPKCPSNAISIIPRSDLEKKIPEANFNQLHKKILDTRQ
jgi:Pyruvate/2-oxoacid:ferredoxin oxidoreductase delta subunit/predicted transcriptional regulator